MLSESLYEKHVTSQQQKKSLSDGGEVLTKCYTNTDTAMAMGKIETLYTLNLHYCCRSKVSQILKNRTT